MKFLSDVVAMVFYSLIPPIFVMMFWKLLAFNLAAVSIFIYCLLILALIVVRIAETKYKLLEFELKSPRIQEAAIGSAAYLVGIGYVLSGGYRGIFVSEGQSVVLIGNILILLFSIISLADSSFPDERKSRLKYTSLRTLFLIILPITLTILFVKP